MAAVVRNRFYWFVALALTLLVLVAFSPTYYLRQFFDAPPITLLLHAHSIVFTAWFVLFVIQAQLISKQNYRTHMQLGIAGMVIAALVVILGIATAVVSAAITRPRPMGMSSEQFVLFPLFAILLFGALVATAFVLRKKPQLHKRFMVLAMIAVLGPPIARLLRITHSGEHFLLVQMAVPAVFVIWCLVSDWFKHRIVHPVYAIGGTLIVLSWPVRVWFAQTPQWESVGSWLAGFSA